MDEGEHTKIADAQNKTHAWLAEEAALVAAHLQSVLARMNAFVPACRIPTELLVEVFIWTRDMCEAPDDSWTRVAHVCSYWRQAALSSQKLWSSISLWTASFVNMMVSRAGNAPLHLVCPFDLVDPDTVLNIYPLTDRFVEAEVHVGVATKGLVEDLFDRSWQSLEVLSILAVGSDVQVYELYLPFDDGPAPPKLRSLELDAVIISKESWRSISACHELRSLQLKDSIGVFLVVWKLIDQFLDLLENFPLLEVLTLNSSGLAPQYLASHSLASPKRTVTLRNLRELSISCLQSEDLTSLLSHLVIPSDADVVLHAKIVIDDYFPYCLPATLSSLGPVEAVAQATITISSLRSIGTICISGQRNNQSLECFSVQTFYTQLLPSTRSALLQLHLIFQHSPELVQVTIICPISHLRDVSAEDWCNILAKFCTVKRLHFSLEVTDDDGTTDWVPPVRLLLAALASSSPSFGPGRLLPALESITLRFGGGDVSQVQEDLNRLWLAEEEATTLFWELRGHSSRGEDRSYTPLESW